MYSLNNVEQVVEDYSLEEVNCLEKPIGVMLNSFNPLYRKFYLLFEKMIQSYNFEYYSQIGIQQMTTMQCSTNILKREMNIQLFRVEDLEDMFRFINYQLAENNPVIVPVNLRELYYSEYYKKADWIHSFLIFGYNEKTKLYNILDCTHRPDEGGKKLYKFVVGKDSLYNMHKSFSKHIYKEGVYYLKSDEIDLEVDVNDLLYKCVYQFCNLRMENPYTELDFIEKITKEKEIGQKKIKDLMHIYHYKKVFYNELEQLLKMMELDTGLQNKFVSIKDRLVENWSQIYGKTMYYLYKKKMEEAQKEIKRVLLLEEEMLACMNKILISLKNSKSTAILVSGHEKFLNNEDGIIKKISDDQFVFEFKNGKIYNNWFEDCAPKIIFNNIDNYKEFAIRSKFILEEYTAGANFVLGIYLKDSGGNSYICGINSGVSILFEHTGVNNAVLEMENCSCITDIEIRIVNRKLKIIYRVDEKKKSYEEQTQIKGNVVSAGICCKTWGEAHKLRFVVKDVKIQM